MQPPWRKGTPRSAVDGVSDGTHWYHWCVMMRVVEACLLSEFVEATGERRSCFILAGSVTIRLEVSNRKLALCLDLECNFHHEFCLLNRAQLLSLLKAFIASLRSQ